MTIFEKERERGVFRNQIGVDQISDFWGRGGSKQGGGNKIKKAPKIPHVQVLKLPKKTKNKSHF